MKLFQFKKSTNESPATGEIVIIDDTPDNLHLLNQILSERGYKVRALPNGEMGLSACQSSPPDLILLDINMPGMDGYECAEKLKADPATREVPIIFISALTQTEDKIRAFSAGGVDYVSKPLQAEEVMARVETHLSISRMRDQINEANQKLLAWNMEMAQRGPGGVAGDAAQAVPAALAERFGKPAGAIQPGDETRTALAVLAVAAAAGALAEIEEAIREQLGGAVLGSFGGVLVVVSAEKGERIGGWLEEQFGTESLSACLESGEGNLRFVGEENGSTPRLDFESQAVLDALAGLKEASAGG